MHYLEPVFRTRCETVYPNGIGSSEVIGIFIHLKGIISSGLSSVMTLTY